MVRSVLVIAAASTLALTAYAQTEPTDDPLAALSDVAEEEEELSELDMLSRSGDDPFGGVVEQAQREPVSVTLRALNKITARSATTAVPGNAAENGAGTLQI